MNQSDPAQFTDMTVTASPHTIAILTDVARRAGVLVSRSAPVVAGPRDPRHRVRFRLRTDR